MSCWLKSTAKCSQLQWMARTKLPARRLLAAPKQLPTDANATLSLVRINAADTLWVYFLFGADNVPGTAQEISPDRSGCALCRGRRLPKSDVDPRPAPVCHIASRYGRITSMLYLLQPHSETSLARIERIHATSARTEQPKHEAKELPDVYKRQTVVKKTGSCR